MKTIQTQVKDSFAALLKGERVVVELGCGPVKPPGSIGIDVVDLPAVDVVADINEGLPFLPDACVDEIQANHLLEHMTSLETVISEIARVLKPNGVCYVYVPHFSNPNYYSDYTHRTPWGMYTIGYFCKGGWPYSRPLPDFYNDIDVRLVSQRFVFYSRFHLIRWAKKGVQLLVNSSRLTQELYEELFAWIVPADGLEMAFKPGPRRPNTP